MSEQLPIPDLRRSGAGRPPSRDLIDVIHASLRRQDWFREYAVAQGIEPSALTGAVVGREVVTAAATARELLQFGVDGRQGLRRDGVRNHLRRAFEEAGGLVVFSSMVGNNNHRMLDRGEFRGFTLADAHAPFVFVNTHQDALTGQLFTFLHESVHVMRDESGLGDEDLADAVVGNGGDHAEGWCNAVAAEVLVPAEDVRQQFRDSEPLDPELDRLSRRYRCSTLVILVRLRDTGLVTRDRFDEAYPAEVRRIESNAVTRRKPGGGDFYRNQPFRIGDRLARAVIGDIYEGRTSYAEALSLLGLSTAEQIDRVAERLGIR